MNVILAHRCSPLLELNIIKAIRRKRWSSANSYKRQKTIRFGEIRDSVRILDSVRDSDSVNCRFLIRIRDSRFGYSNFRFGFGIRDSVSSNFRFGFEIRDSVSSDFRFGSGIRRILAYMRILDSPNLKIRRSLEMSKKP